MMFGTFVMLVATVAVVVLIVSSGLRNRWPKTSLPPRRCGQCGTIHASFARFCKRCGKQLY